jgi:hypothetical protein
VDYLDKVINTYNHSEQKALNYLTPDEVGMKANKNLIEEINQLKSIENHTVSDLKIDDKVRIKILGTFKKGTEPTFSDKVYIVKKIKANTIKLDNDKKYKRNDLLLVPSNAKSLDENIISKNNKLAKVKRTLNQLN